MSVFYFELTMLSDEPKKMYLAPTITISDPLYFSSFEIT